MGTQLDCGLSAPLIVDPAGRSCPMTARRVLLFDDWLDGVAGTPDRQLATLRAQGKRIIGMDMDSDGGMSSSRRRHSDLAGDAPGQDRLAHLANDLEAAAGRS